MATPQGVTATGNDAVAMLLVIFPVVKWEKVLADEVVQQQARSMALVPSAGPLAA
ncbi:hypothetical protein [Streptomyces syringium]|uniref:hypothetical protein n=1 Tax=Streptomyces syringium TaxID=76729 RepID=UPI0034545B4B